MSDTRDPWEPVIQAAIEWAAARTVIITTTALPFPPGSIDRLAKAEAILHRAIGALGT